MLEGGAARGDRVSGARGRRDYGGAPEEAEEGLESAAHGVAEAVEAEAGEGGELGARREGEEEDGCDVVEALAGAGERGVCACVRVRAHAKAYLNHKE